jgi:hypothetical protein
VPVAFDRAILATSQRTQIIRHVAELSQYGRIVEIEFRA